MKAEGAFSARSPLIIGVGNRDRGDDGIGPIVIDHLRDSAPQLETLVAEGDLSDLVLRWSSNQDVIVVDAVRSARPPGSVTTTDALSRGLPTEASLLSSHGVGLAETVELARLLDRLPQSLVVVGVEAQSFGQFEPLSEAVAAAIPAALQQVLQLAGTSTDSAINERRNSGPCALWLRSKRHETR